MAYQQVETKLVRITRGYHIEARLDALLPRVDLVTRM